MGSVTAEDDNGSNPGGDPPMESAHTPGLKLLFAASLLQQKKPIISNQKRTQAPETEADDETPSQPVTYPSEKDVLCGRGGMINKHSGNIVYRRIVDYNKTVYKQVPKRHRVLVSESIVQTILNNGGRFLQHEDDSIWMTVSIRRAVQKTSQALREREKEDHISRMDPHGSYTTEGNIQIEEKEKILQSASSVMYM